MGWPQALSSRQALGSSEGAVEGMLGAWRLGARRPEGLGAEGPEARGLEACRWAGVGGELEARGLEAGGTGG